MADSFLLKLLYCAGSGTDKAVRCRAVKCVGAAVEVDPTLLTWQSVCDCIGAALRDDAATVHEAALDILDKAMARSVASPHAANDPHASAPVVPEGSKEETVQEEEAKTAAGEALPPPEDVHDGYFDMLAASVTDAGLLVKKRAMRILWEHFVVARHRTPRYRLDAELAVLTQEAD